MLPVLIAFAGVLTAAAATGMLAGRCVRGVCLCFSVWTVAALGLLVALAATGVGLATGFGPVSFHAIEVGGQLIAPLWLAWGLIELVTRSQAVRFGVRLGCGFALPVAIGPILVADTSSAAPFSKSWPLVSQPYQPVSHYALLLAQGFAIIGALAAVGVAWVRGRSEPQWAPALAGVGALGLAVLLTVALRFSLPSRSAYPLVATFAAGLIWFGVTRGLSTVDDSWRPAGRGERSRRSSRRDDRDDRDTRDPRAQRDDSAQYGRHEQRPEPPRYEPGQYAQDPYRQDQYGQDPYRQDQYGQDQYGRSQHGYGGQYDQPQYAPDQYAPDPYAPDPYAPSQNGHDPYGQAQYAPDPYTQGRHSRDQSAPDAYGADPHAQASYEPGRYPADQPARYPADQPAPDPYGSEQRYRSDQRAPDPYGYGRYETSGRGERPASRAADPRAAGMGTAGPGPTSQASAGVPVGQQMPAAPAPAQAEAEFATEAGPASRGGAQSRPYGRLQIFTLLDDKAADFDRLAEQTAEEVRIGEPDTLVYVIHLVPNAPMQRIFYEIYRDRAAFDSHENKSYTRRFVAERRAYVLATNVIELRLKYAKVAPLPVDSRQLDPGRAARAQLPPGPAATAPRYDTTAPRYETPAPSAPRQPRANGQRAQPPADPRYGRV
jgi:quinol monooxygenase YgiN